MAFTLSSSQEASQKIRINLSSLAWDVIEHDVAAFGNGCKTGNFLNDILESYIPKAQASVGRRLRYEDSELHEYLADIPEEVEIRRRLFDRKKHQLLEQLQSYEESDKGSSRIYRLRNEVVALLTSSECEEDQYYDGKIGAYIKAIIEEYVRLPYGMRERIYFTKTLLDVDQAIQEGCILEVKAANDTVYAAWPYDIVHDPMDTANYLVCFSQRYEKFNAGWSELQPTCFRISRLKFVRRTSARGRLSDIQQQELKKKLRTRGVQFLSYEEKKVVVRLTSDGQRKYRSLRYLRPSYIDVEGDIYTFNCTLNQAEFYFLKFGQDAEILEPFELRKRFARVYQVAYNLYQ